MKKAIVKKLENKIFDIDTYFVYGSSIQLIDWVKEENTKLRDDEQYNLSKIESGLDEDSYGMFLCGAKILWMNTNAPSFKKACAILMHECIHLAFCVCHRRDISADVMNQESLCYLADYYFQECYDILKDNHKDYLHFEYKKDVMDLYVIKDGEGCWQGLLDMVIGDDHWVEAWMDWFTCHDGIKDAKFQSLPYRIIKILKDNHYNIEKYLNDEVEK